MKFISIKLVYSIIFFTSLNSCINIKDKKTSIEVEDNDRHYYAIVAGQKKDIAFKVKNTGKNPLVVTDIITSCGCIKRNDERYFTIPAGKERMIQFTYDSDKNIGYVKHYISLYGNFKDQIVQELLFDINVVPNALYTKDYEEIHRENKDERLGVETLVDGDLGNKGYYMK